MIYYRLADLNDDGTPKRNIITTCDRLSDANEYAQLIANASTPVAVVKVTEQHLGTFRSKEHGTN